MTFFRIISFILLIGVLISCQSNIHVVESQQIAPVTGTWSMDARGWKFALKIVEDAEQHLTGEMFYALGNFENSKIDGNRIGNVIQFKRIRGGTHTQSYTGTISTSPDSGGRTVMNGTFNLLSTANYPWTAIEK